MAILCLATSSAVISSVPFLVNWEIKYIFGQQQMSWLLPLAVFAFAAMTLRGITMYLGRTWLDSMGERTVATASDGILASQDTTPPNPPTSVTDDGATTTSTTTLHAVWAGASDPQSGIAEYKYAIGTSPSDPGSGYTANWTSTGTTTSVTRTGLSLRRNSTYYFYVKSKNGAGLWSTTSTASNGIQVIR